MENKIAVDHKKKEGWIFFNNVKYYIILFPINSFKGIFSFLTFFSLKNLMLTKRNYNPQHLSLRTKMENIFLKANAFEGWCWAGDCTTQMFLQTLSWVILSAFVLSTLEYQLRNCFPETNWREFTTKFHLILKSLQQFPPCFVESQLPKLQPNLFLKLLFGPINLQ